MVKPANQGKGISPALLRAAEAAFPVSRDGSSCYTSSRSVANVRLYVRHGYLYFITHRQAFRRYYATQRKR